MTEPSTPTLPPAERPVDKSLLTSKTLFATAVAFALALPDILQPVLPLFPPQVADYLSRISLMAFAVAMVYNRRATRNVGRRAKEQAVEHADDVLTTALEQGEPALTRIDRRLGETDHERGRP